MNYPIWLAQVDAALRAIAHGLGLETWPSPDMPTLFNDQISPAEAAQHVLEHATLSYKTSQLLRS